MIERNSISAVILAGGKSRRMGRDKAFIEWNDKTFLEHIIETVSSFTNEIIISGNDNRLKEFGFEVVPDEVFDKGPVGGLATALKKVNTNNVIVLSCDVPQISKPQISNLIESHKDDFDISCYSFQNRLMPLIGIYKQELYKVFYKSLIENNLKLTNVISELNVNSIETGDELGIYNINSETDLRVLR